MYRVIQSAGRVVLFTGTQAECWQYMDDEGLGAGFYVEAA